VFHYMILIFHSFKGRSINFRYPLERFWICTFFRSGFGCADFSDLEDFLNNLPVSHLKYNALDDFKKSCGLPGSLLTKSSSISSGVQTCLCRGMIYNSFTTYMEVVSKFFLTNKDGRLPCKSSINAHLKVNCKINLCIDQKTSIEITCLSHISLFQAPKISNKSDPPKNRKLQWLYKP
ncbi:hypothetical protein IGI04_035311, partial [Brassica rapa subsp. trilocularis]